MEFSKTEAMGGPCCFQSLPDPQIEPESPSVLSLLAEEKGGFFLAMPPERPAIVLCAHCMQVSWSV